MNCEGWAPGSSTNPTQSRGDLSEPRFPRDDGLIATIRPLDDYSNTYIGIHWLGPAVGTGHYKYAEYVTATRACICKADVMAHTAHTARPARPPPRPAPCCLAVLPLHPDRGVSRCSRR